MKMTLEELGKYLDKVSNITNASANAIGNSMKSLLSNLK